jgi:hypothetical protein
MAKRKPQINFQVEEAMKYMYDEARLSGHLVTRLCAAGLLLLVEDGLARKHALNRLREWEVEFADATAEDVRAFVQGAEDAARGSVRGTRPARAARSGRRKAKPSGSA